MASINGEIAMKTKHTITALMLTAVLAGCGSSVEGVYIGHALGLFPLELEIKGARGEIRGLKAEPVPVEVVRTDDGVIVRANAKDPHPASFVVEERGRVLVCSACAQYLLATRWERKEK
jgi:hypothetical protein